jgi:tetratricopeptide (TPR) repeat protein
MIRLPAEAAGLHFEQEGEKGQRLDQALRDAASATPESLPLLEHVLSLLYDQQNTRGDGLLRWSDYRELGELKGALAKHADAVFGRLPLPEQKAFPLVMRHLVALGQGEEEVPNRRTVPYRDFTASEGSDDQKAGAKGFVDLFVQERLLVADTDPQGEVTVSVAHEALLREWQRVKEWLTENREFLRMRDRLDSSMKLWLSRGKQKDDLLEPGLHLAEGEKLVKDFRPSLSREQIDYVYASVAERNRRRKAQARIRYAVMTVLGALTIVAGFQWLQAERQRQSANAARQSAEGILNYLLNQLSAKLEPIGHLDVVQDVQKQVETYYKNLGFSDRDPKAASNWTTLLQKEGDRLLAQGDLNGAKAKYQEILEIARKLAEHAPSDAAWQRILSVAYESLGDVLMQQGDLGGAKMQFEHELDIRRPLAEQAPGDNGRQRDLSVCYKRLGDALKAQGDRSGAKALYERALEIMEGLVKKEPGNAIWQDDLFIMHVMVGDIASLLGDLSGSKAEYQNALAASQKTVELEPGNTRWQRNLAASYNRLGDALKALGDLNSAKVQYEKGFDTTNRLAKQDPSNSDWQNDLFVSYDVLGALLLTQGNLSEAKTQCLNGLAIIEKLAKQEPANSQRQSDLSVSYEDLGDIYRAEKDFDNAFSEYRAALDTVQKLVEKDSDNGDWQHALAVAHQKVGDVLLDRNEFFNAKAEYKSAVASLQSLVDKNPANTDYQHDLSGAYRGLGQVQKADGDAAAALQNFRASLDILARLIQWHGENPAWKTDLDSVKKLAADQ